MPKSTFDIPKEKLYIRLSANSTRHERNSLKNNLLNFIKDEQVVVFDSKSFLEDVEEQMVMLDVFNWVISGICFILGLFQLVVTISANIRDSMWELGVLRAMGMTK